MIKKTLLIIFFTIFSFNVYAKTKTVHTIVALCDNLNQRIYPVPINLGWGHRPDSNLYWGAMYGIKTFFKNSPNWIFISEEKNISKNILRRAIFKHKDSDTFMIADAYLGKSIKLSIEDFASYSSGENGGEIKTTYQDKEYTLSIGGNADLITYVGHNALMDFSFDKKINTPEENKKDIMILACLSKAYFSKVIEKTKAHPVLLTKSKMAPEGYVLEAAINAWIKNEDAIVASTKAYAKYQKISDKAARSVFTK